MRATCVACALAVLTFLSASALADQVPNPEQIQAHSSSDRNPELDAVTVTAERRREILEQRISVFVSSIAIHSHTESLARWQVPICPFVLGASSGNAEYFEGRLLQIAADAGVPAAAKDCTPNFAIILTPEPERLLRDWWSRNPRLFNKDRGIGGINHFIESEEAIRVWYNACSVSPGSARNFVLKGDPACDTGQLGSRLTWASVRSIYSVIVIVDLKRVEGLNVGQLSDFSAMIGLAQLRTDTDLGNLPTILNLFAETRSARPQGLSSWDRSFLKSLYETETGNVKQVSQIKNGMQRALLP